MRNFKRVLYTCIFVIFHAVGVALGMKASIGVMAFDAFTQTVAEFTSIRVGTMLIIVNFFFVVMQFIILRKDFKIYQFLQVLVASILGFMVNIFYYDVFNFELSSYVFKVIALIIALFIQAFSIGGMMSIGLITYPGEGFSLAVSKKTSLSFPKARQLLDVGMIVLSLVFTFIFSLSLYIREGTIIGAILFSPLLGIFRDKMMPIFERNNLGKGK